MCDSEEKLEKVKYRSNGTSAENSDSSSTKPTHNHTIPLYLFLDGKSLEKTQLFFSLLPSSKLVYIFNVITFILGDLGSWMEFLEGYLHCSSL